MSERYYLFRGDELVCTNTEDENGQLGAGDSHARGQAGDILVCTRGHDSWLRAWHWNDQNHSVVGKQMAWLDIPPEKLDANKYRVLILLQK
jgi:hypothetical protein